MGIELAEGNIGQDVWRAPLAMGNFEILEEVPPMGLDRTMTGHVLRPCKHTHVEVLVI